MQDVGKACRPGRSLLPAAPDATQDLTGDGGPDRGGLDRAPCRAGAAGRGPGLGGLHHRRGARPRRPAEADRESGTRPCSVRSTSRIDNDSCEVVHRRSHLGSKTAGPPEPPDDVTGRCVSAAGRLPDRHGGPKVVAQLVYTGPREPAGSSPRPFHPLPRIRRAHIVDLHYGS